MLGVFHKRSHGWAGGPGSSAIEIPPIIKMMTIKSIRISVSVSFNIFVDNKHYTRTAVINMPFSGREDGASATER